MKPDAVLTFEDLKQWLSEEQIEIEACEEEPFEDREPGANLRYPVSGGLLTAVTATQKKPDKYRKFYVSGVKDCLDVCEAMKTGEVAGCVMEAVSMDRPRRPPCRVLKLSWIWKRCFRRNRQIYP